MQIKNRLTFNLLFAFYLIFNAYAAFAELKTDAVYPASGELGKDLEVTLTGSGFDENTRVSMILDTGNTRYIIGFVDTPGHAEGVAVIGNTAFVADGESGLQIMDVTVCSKPEIISSLNTPGKAVKVTVQNDIAYMADGESGLQIIDVSSRSNPRMISSLDTPGYASRVRITGDIAYVADKDSLLIIDISDLSNPNIISSVDNYAYDVSVVENTAYIVGSNRLEIIDISDPFNPVSTGFTDTLTTAKGLTVAEDMAYVVCRYGSNSYSRWNGLQVINVSSPSNPASIASVDTPLHARSVAVFDDRVYVADSGGLQIMQITDVQGSGSTSKYHTVIGSVEAGGWAYEVVVVKDTAYIAYGNGGLQIIDVSNPSKSAKVGSAYTPLLANGITINKDKAYVAYENTALSGGLRIIDVSNPSDSVIVGSVENLGPARDVKVIGDMAYVANGVSLSIIDVKDASNPVVVGSVDTPNFAMEVAVVGNLAYVANYDCLQVIEITNPSDPVIIGSIETPGQARGITVAGDTAYIADYDSGLQIINISNPSNPFIISSIDTSGYAENIELIENIAYVGDGIGGLQIIDVSNPSSPVIIGAEESISPAHGITVVEKTAYIANGNGGISAVDVSNPSNPVEIGYVGTPGYAHKVSVVGNKAYVAALGGGFVVVPLPTEIKPVFAENETTLSFTLPSPEISGSYILRAFNNEESDLLVDGVTFSNKELTLESVYPTLGEIDKELEITLKGAGFDQNTKVSVFLDTANRKTMIGSADTPDYAIDVSVADGKSYIADSDGGLQIVDVSNPSTAHIIGSLETSENARGVKVIGDKVYLGIDGSLQIIDVSNPSAPCVIGSVNTSYYIKGIEVKENIAYVASGKLHIIDVSDPSNPYIKGSVDTSYASKVDIVGNTAYIASDPLFLTYDGLYIADVSDPSNPYIINSVHMSIVDVEVIGNIAYIAEGQGGTLKIMDVSNPLLPRLLSSVDGLYSAESVTIVGNTAYVPSSVDGLQIIDVSNPSSPKLIRSVDTPDYAMNVEIVGDTAYVADGESGLQIIDINNYSVTKTVNYNNMQGVARGIKVIGDKTYVADSMGGVHIFDTSDPSYPDEIGFIDVSDSDVGSGLFGKGISVAGNTAYVTCRDSGLHIIDISNPENPVQKGHLALKTASGVTGTGDIAYVADYNGCLEGITDFGTGYIEHYTGCLQIIDVSSRSNPVIISSANTSGFAIEATVIDGKAYVLSMDEWNGLEIIDVSDPENPTVIGSVNMPDFPVHIKVLDGTAYIADRWGGLQIVDVWNPSYPKVIGSIETPDLAYGVDVIEDIAYVSVYGNGLYAIDVSNPSNPVIIGSVSTPGRGYDVAVAGDTAYIADLPGGLTIVPVPIKIKDVALKDETTISLTLPIPQVPGHYTIRVFNETENYELPGAVTFVPSEKSYILDTKAIIVAGTDGNTLKEETQSSTDYAYEALLYQGYTAESICYLSSIRTSDKGVDGDATLEALEKAIKTWALEEPYPTQLILYLVDHGTEGKFRINPYQYLSAASLDNWLDDLQNNTPDIPVIFIYDACRSGSFLSQLKPPEGKERIILTSASKEESAFFVDNGILSFSWQFWDAIYKGEQVDDAFFHARDQMLTYQEPILEANGNGIGNEDNDKVLADNKEIRRGYRKRTDAPYIYDISEKRILPDETSATIQASVGCADEDTEIRRVWAIITPPDFNPEASDIPVTELPTIDLTDPDDDGFYEGVYDNFNVNGTYGIAICAMNTDGDYALFQKTAITKVTNYIAKIFDPKTLYGQDDPVTLWAAISREYDNIISRVWVEMTHSKFSDTIELTDPDNNGIYEAVYNFTMTGTYSIYIYAEDTEGFVSPGVHTTVSQKGTTYYYPGADSFEPDDTFNLAHAITLYDEPNPHTFHAPGDTEWIKIWGTAGTIYKMRTSNLSMICDTVIELYQYISKEKIMVPVTEKDDNNAGEDESLEWQCPQNGYYFVRLRHSDPDIFGENVSYDFQIGKPIGSYSGIIQGTVTDIIGKPLMDARIYTNAGGSDLSRDNGYYLLKHVPGSCTLIIEADGYRRFETSVMVRENETITLNVVMKSITIEKGDINGNGEVNLEDAVLILQLISGRLEKLQTVYKESDVNENDQIGLEEAIYVIQKVSQIR